MRMCKEKSAAGVSCKVICGMISDAHMHAWYKNWQVKCDACNL